MLEVLIALTVLSVGILGLAYLQTWGIRFSQESFYRSQATTIAYEFMDRIRANALHGGRANVSLDALTTGPSSETPCMASTTTAIAPQIMDKDCFFYRLKNTLPAGNGSVVQKGTGSFISLEITIAWNDRGLVVANPNLASTAANADHTDNTAAACDPPRKHSSDPDFTWSHSTDPDVCLQTQSWVIGI